MGLILDDRLNIQLVGMIQKEGGKGGEIFTKLSRLSLAHSYHSVTESHANVTGS